MPLTMGNTLERISPVGARPSPSPCRRRSDQVRHIHRLRNTCTWLVTRSHGSKQRKLQNATRANPQLPSKRQHLRCRVLKGQQSVPTNAT